MLAMHNDDSPAAELARIEQEASVGRAMNKRRREAGWRKRFRIALCHLAKMCVEDVRIKALSMRTAQEALEVLHLMVRLRHPYAFGPQEVLAHAPNEFPEKFTAWAMRGEIPLNSSQPFGGITVERIGRAIKACRRPESAAEVAAKIKLLKLGDLKFRCPRCKKVKLSPRQWVTVRNRNENRMNDHMAQQAICRKCWGEWCAEHRKGVCTTAKDKRIPDVGGECPRCSKHVPNRANWRLSVDGTAVCKRCRQKEIVAGAGSAPSRIALRDTAASRERRKEHKQREKMRVLIASYDGVCPLCKQQVQSEYHWRYAKRVKKGLGPCCRKCYDRWRRRQA